MKVLVTGGAGYIGSVLIPTLLQAGHHVTVVDNLLYGQTSLLDVCFDPGLEVVRGDARDRELMKRLIDGQDVLIPLAALVGAPLCARDPDAACAINVGAIELLLQLRDPAQWVIYPNTNSGYGLGQGESFCTEDTPLNPISVYGRTKCQAEQAVLSAGNAITFRLATVFGVSPRMRLDLLVNVLFEAHFKRNYVHVRDVARAFMHAIDNFETMREEPYNVGLSDANLSKQELCERIQRFVPNFYFVEAALGEDPDKRNYVVSNARIEATGFQPRYSLDDGIRELLKAYQVVRRTQFSNV